MTIPARFKGGQRGIALLEPMIVLAIILIIATFAYPSYTQYVVNTKRNAATSILLQIAERQQQFFMDNKRYAKDLTNLGFSANPLFVSSDGSPAAVGNTDTVYVFGLANVAATTYIAVAAPLAGQLERDTDCATLTLNQAGARGATGAADDCWR
ncbi:MAG: type IV pilin protein [Woeseiaceae bacterium]|nr:type IV pilin protein [Woeseiaceae bacterium]MDX2608225.1 type IV pilin protein [Woeseiaceae bacterium]